MRVRPQGLRRYPRCGLSSMSAERGPIAGHSAPMAGLGSLSAGMSSNSRRTAQGQPWAS